MQRRCKWQPPSLPDGLILKMILEGLLKGLEADSESTLRSILPIQIGASVRHTSLRLVP